MFKKFFGIDFIDFLIQFGVTFAVAVIASNATRPNDEIGISLIFGASLVVLGWRRARALKQQTLAPVTTGEVQLERLSYLEDRVAELEQTQQKVLELEDRLDFTERLLAQQRDAGVRIGPGQ